MAPPPPTAPLSALPLPELCEFSPTLAFHGDFSPQKHTTIPDAAATITSKLYVQSSHQYVNASAATRPPPALVHTNSNILSATSHDPPFPHTILPPLSWAVKPLTVRVPSPPPSPCTQPSPTGAPTHTAVSASLPPSSRLAARHHPPLLRHLVDRSVPPPSCVDWPQFISNAASAAERPVTTAAERRRLSAPAAAHHHHHHPASGLRVGSASTDFSVGAQNVENGAGLAVVEKASDGRGVTYPVTSHTMSTDSICTPGHDDTQKTCSFKRVPLATCSTDTPPKGASPQNEARASRKEGTPLGPLLHHLLLTPQKGPHCPVHAGPKDEQYVQQWRCPRVLLPPFFSSPAALQRSENTLQSELASSVLRCRAAELRQQRLLQIAAAVVHQAVRVHASRIVDIIEMHGTAAASASRRAALPATSDKENASRLDKASSREIDDKKVTFTTRYYDWLCGPAELNNCSSSSSDRGVLQCLPVIVAPAGADVADHRLAVHGLLRECVRRCQRDRTVDSRTPGDCTSQRDSLFLRFAVIRPTHCASVGKAMHAIYEQITQIPLSSRASPAGRSGVKVVGRSSRSQQEAPVQKPRSRTSSRNALHSDRRATLHSSANHNLRAGNNGLFACYDGGAAAAWGENTWLFRRSAHVFSAGDDASLLACVDAGLHDEVEVATELQQLSGRDLWGAAAGASDVGSLRRQEEFWEIEKEAEAAAALDACQAEQSTCGGAGRSSCHHDSFQGQTKKGDFQRQTQSVHQQQHMEQQQQQRVRQGHPGAEQRRRGYDALQQPRECNNLPFLSRTSSSGTARSYVRRSGESDNVCEKLACWWAAQQQLLLQRSSERCNDDGIAGAAAAAALASFPSRHRTCKQARGVKCASWGVRTRAASTLLLDSAAAEGNIPPSLFEAQSDEEDKRQHERISEGSAEQGKRENREEDAVEEATTTDKESNDEQDLYNDTRMLRGTRGKIAATAAAPPAAPSPGRNGNSRSNIMQPAAVVIVFEEAEAFPGGLLVRLLQLLALLRQQLSLPFIVVATASTNATVLQQLCDSPLSSSCCVTVEPATLLQPARVQQQLLQLLLCCPAALPFTLPLAVAEKLLQSIEETSPSALQLLRRLQLLLRLYYQHHPLAFLCRDLDGVAALMGPQYDGCASTAAAPRQQQQQCTSSSSSNTAAHAAAARFARSSYERPLPVGTHEEEEARPKEEETEEKKSSTTTQDRQFLQQDLAHTNSRDAGEAAYDSAAGRAKTASPAAKDLDDDLARELHALHVVKQLRRRVELLSFASLTGDHVHMLRQLLRHTNEVFIHLTAAQQEGLFFLDRCCWQQVRLQRQHQRRMLLAAAAAASNGAAFSCSSSLLRPLQRDAAASTLALRCRPEEDGEQQKQQQCSKSSESGGPGATGGGFTLLETVGGAACAAEDYMRRKTHWGCHRLAGCVARRSTLGLLKSWWGGRGLLLLQKVEEEEKQQKQQQQQDQEEQKHLPSATTASGFSQAARGGGGGDTQGDLLPLRLKFLCKEVLPAASVELLQRRVGYCMAYRLLFVLQQQLQRYRRLASAAATDAEAAATAGNCGGGFARAAEAGQLAGNVNLPAGGNSSQQQEATAAEEEELLLRIAAEEEANSNCRQTIETLDLLVGAHEEFSCLLRKCKPRARVQEMAKACFAVEQDVRRVVVSLFEQFAVAAPVRVSAAVAATHTPEPLADPAALVLPLKLFRAQVKREARLLRLLAAAEEAQQRREQQLACAGDGASSMDAAAAASQAPVKEQACEIPQQQLPFSSQAPTHAFEVVRMLDTLDALICDLSKAAAPAVPSADPASAEVAAAGYATHRGVEHRALSGACKSETASFGAPANTQRRGGKEVQSDTYSNKKEVQDAEATAGQHRLARIPSCGAGLTISAAAAQQKRRQTQPAAGALRAMLSLKRKFLRWVEEALLLLLLPLPGWHPLGGELAVWGGALGFQVAAAVQSPPETGADPPAATDCPRLLNSSAGNTGSASQKRYTAGTLSGTLAAAADLVCSSFEAAPQTETLQHAAMSSTSFLQRFNVPLEEEGEEEEGKEAYTLQALPQQQKQKRQPQLQQLSQRQEEASLELSSEADRVVRKGKGTEKCGDRAEQEGEEIKLEDVAILLRLVNGAGRRINLWDLFCAFCRDLLKNRIKKKKTEIQKKRQRGTYEEKGEKVQCSWPDNVSSNSSSPQPGTSTGSVSQKWSSQRQKKRHTRISESDIEEEVLRLMEAESCSLHADTTADCNNSECSNNTGPTSGPPHPKECQHAPKLVTEEDSQPQKAASSRIVQADLLYAKCTSHTSRSPVGTPRGTPVSHTVDAAASPDADASTNVRISRAAGAVPAQLPGSVGGEGVPWTLLQQLQLRFAVAVETLDQQLGVIRLPSAASAAAAVERVMLAEEGGEDAAVNPDFSVIPPGGEQAAGGDELSRQLVDEIEESEEDASEVEGAEEGELPAARDAGVGAEQEKHKRVGVCKAGGGQVQDEHTEQPGTRYARALRSRRSTRLGLAAGERERSAVSPWQEQQEDIDENDVPLVAGDDMLMHELRTMRKLLRNVFARRIHFVSVSVCPAEESGDGTVESGGSDAERFSDEEVEGRSLRKKSCTSRRKSNRRSRKKVLL